MNAAEIILNDELQNCLAQLYCREKQLHHYVFSPLTEEQADKLRALDLVENNLAIKNMRLAYAAFEHYRQNICPDMLDKLFLEKAGQNKVILDMCCGPGATVRALMKTRPRFIYAVDRDAYYIELVNQLIKCMNMGNVQTMTADVHNLPLKNESVDVVVCRVALQHLHIDKALDEISRVLKEGGNSALMVHGIGYIIFTALKREFLTTVKLVIRGMQFFFTRKQSRPSEIFLTSKILINLLEKRGFTNFSVAYSDKLVNYGPLPLYFLVACEKSRTGDYRSKEDLSGKSN